MQVERSLAYGLVLGALVLALGAAGCQSSGSKNSQEMAGGQGALETGSEFQEESLASNPGPAAQGFESAQLAPIYFDYDRFEIREDAEPALRSNAQTIQERSDWRRLTIEGHCDERGSEEYNLALGERRASVVKRYLVDLGVSGSRLETVSFGEAQPAMRGHGESTWRYNRRAEFKVNRGSL